MSISIFLSSILVAFGAAALADRLQSRTGSDRKELRAVSARSVQPRGWYCFFDPATLTDPDIGALGRARAARATGRTGTRPDSRPRARLSA